MKRKWLKGSIGGAIGSVIGVLGGGYLGLIIGGTFLGGLDLNRYIPLEGYELMAYVGAASGAILGSVLGAKHALKKEGENT